MHLSNLSILRTIRVAVLSLAVLGSFSALTAFAAPASTGTNVSPTTGTNASSDSSGQTLVNPLNNISSLPELLTAVLHAIVQLGSIILVLALVFVGFRFVAARGNPGEILKARTALIYTLIGGLILLGAEGIAAVVQSTVAGL